MRWRALGACATSPLDRGACDEVAGRVGRGARTGPDRTSRGRAAGSAAGPERSRPRRVGVPMDKETKREIWLLAVGTIIAEAPFVAIAAFVALTR